MGNAARSRLLYHRRALHKSDLFENLREMKLARGDASHTAPSVREALPRREGEVGIPVGLPDNSTIAGDNAVIGDADIDNGVVTSRLDSEGVISLTDGIHPDDIINSAGAESLDFSQLIVRRNLQRKSFRRSRGGEINPDIVILKQELLVGGGDADGSPVVRCEVDCIVVGANGKHVARRRPYRPTGRQCSGSHIDGKDFLRLGDIVIIDLNPDVSRAVGNANRPDQSAVAINAISGFHDNIRVNRAAIARWRRYHNCYGKPITRERRAVGKKQGNRNIHHADILFHALFRFIERESAERSNHNIMRGRISGAEVSRLLELMGKARHARNP